MRHAGNLPRPRDELGRYLAAAGTTQVVHIRAPRELLAQLDAAAGVEGVSRAALCRCAWSEWLEDWMLRRTGRRPILARIEEGK